MKSTNPEDCLASEIYGNLADELATLEGKIGRLLYALKWNNRIPKAQRILLLEQEKAMFLYRGALRARMEDIMIQLGTRD